MNWFRAGPPETQDHRAVRLGQEAQAKRDKELGFDLTKKYAKTGYDWLDPDLTGTMVDAGWNPTLSGVYGYLPDTILPMLGGAIGGAAGFVGDGWEDLTGFTEGRSSGDQLSEELMAMAENPMAGTGVGRNAAVLAADDVPTLTQARTGAKMAANTVVDRANQPGPVPQMNANIPINASLKTGFGPQPPTAGRMTPEPLTLFGGADVADLPPSVQRNINAALEVEPDLHDILPLIHPEEAVGITPRTAQQLTAAYGATDQKALEALALAGDAKRGWYKSSAEAIKHVFGEDQPRFTALLSALSPQTSVESNLSNALNVWKNWTKAGRPTDKAAIKQVMGQSVQGGKGEASVLGAWVNNSVRALSEPDAAKLARLSGPKVDSFGPNTAGDLSRTTLDVHASDGTGFDQNMFSQSGSGKARETNVAGYGPGYIGASAAHRNTAANMTDAFGIPIEPANVQETSWSAIKPLKDLYAKDRNTPMMAQYDAGALTDDLVVGTPDFATLLKQDEYSSILKDAGYGSQLDSLQPPAAVERLGATPNPDDLARGIGTIQTAVDRNGVISAAAPYRVGAGSPDQLGYKSGGRGSSSYSTGDVGGVRLEADPEFRKSLSRVGADAPDFIKADKKSTASVAAQAEDYYSQLAPWQQAMVDLPSAKDMRNGTVLSTDGGQVLVKKSGEIAGVMKGKGGPKQFTLAALHAATQNGGSWLNAYDTVLPEMYSRAGFRPVARVRFNREYAAPGWDYARMERAFGTGEPDIVFMAYDPKFKGKPTRGFAGKVFDDYDDAVAYTKAQAEKK